MAQIRHRVTKASRTLGPVARYRFVDCRWELGKPGRGRELYLAGHIPGAAFLDVERDLSAPAVEGGARHPLPELGGLRGQRPGGRESSPASSWSPTARAAAPSASGGCSATSATTRPRCCAAGSTPGPAHSPPARRRSRRRSSRAGPRTDDTLDADAIAARLGDPSLVVVDARIPSRYRGEPNPIDRVPGRIPGAVNVPWTAEDELPARPARGRGAGRLLRLGRHRLRPAARARASGPAGREALPGLVERLGVERPPGRTGLAARPGSDPGRAAGTVASGALPRRAPAPALPRFPCAARPGADGRSRRPPRAGAARPRAAAASPAVRPSARTEPARWRACR